MEKYRINKVSELLTFLEPSLLSKIKAIGHLKSDWSSIVGDALAVSSRITDVRDGNTLVVEADHPMCIQMLSLEKNVILDKINQRHSLSINSISIKLVQ